MRIKIGEREKEEEKKAHVVLNDDCKLNTEILRN